MAEQISYEHVYRARIAGNVDLAVDVEEICLLDSSCVGKSVQQVLESVELGNQLLDHTAESFKDTGVEDRGDVVGYARIDVAGIGELVADSGGDVGVDVAFHLIRQAVCLVDEDFDEDLAIVGLLKIHDCHNQSVERVVVIILRIDDPDKCADVLEYLT